MKYMDSLHLNNHQKIEVFEEVLESVREQALVDATQVKRHKC